MIGPVARKPICCQSLSVWMAGAGAPADGPATMPEPATEASTTRVHVVAGRSGSNETPSPGAPNPAGMKPADTPTRSHSGSVGNRNGDPLPSGAVIFTSPTRYCVCVHEFKKAPMRAARPTLRPPP